MSAPVAALALLLGAIPASAQAPSSGTVKVALIEDVDTALVFMSALPIERLLRDSGKAQLTGVDSLPCFFSGNQYYYKVPPLEPGLPSADASTTTAAAILETGSELLVVSPPLPALLEALRAALADPSSYRLPYRVAASSSAALLGLVTGPEGEILVSARFDMARPGAEQWRRTVASHYRLRWDHEPVSVTVISRTFGGLGRLATAVEAERASGVPLVGVACGQVFGGDYSEVKGRALAEALERMGLRYSAVSYSEIKNWEELQAYREERPEGIQFLSANLVLASSPTSTLLPDHIVVSAGGLRLAVTGVTPPQAERYLKASIPEGEDAAVTDPVVALESRLSSLREAADAVIVLSDLSAADNARLRSSLRGVDVIFADDEGFLGFGPENPRSGVVQKARHPYSSPLWTVRDPGASLNVLEIGIAPQGDKADWSVAQTSLLLDETVADTTGYAELDLERFGVDVTTAPPLLPAARKIFPPGSPGKAGGFPMIEAREFWTLAATLLAEETDSELSLLPVRPLATQNVGDIKEGLVREWLSEPDPVLLVTLKGSEVQRLLKEADSQREREERRLPSGGRLRFTSGGARGGRVHGVPVDERLRYKVAATRTLVEVLGLSPETPPEPTGEALGETVLESLRRRSRDPLEPHEVRDWMDGRAVRETGLWKINFRDVGLNVQNTKVVRDDAFNSVPNSRIQGFDELLVGGVFKADAEYLKGVYKWTNTLEMEYARSRLRPRNQEPITNTTANRLSVLTSGTRRAGAIGYDWLARSWGPSLGLQYEGQFEAAPGLRRKQIYSAYPGVEFYDGTLVRTLEAAGNVKRDLSRDPPNTQYGLRGRVVVAREVGPAKAASLQGELYANYFFLTKKDLPQDLRVEGDVNLKLRIPVYKHLSVAPFVDFYFFQLKVRPLWGYSAMTGVTIGFSRLWKPQYERF